MKTIMRACLIGALALVVAGCGDKSAPVQAAPGAKTPGAVGAAPAAIKVAFVMKAINNPYFSGMEQGARRAEKDSGIELIVQSTHEETAIEEQITLVENQIADHVSAIVIAPVDSKRLVPALKKAQDAGIKIVNVDNRLDDATLKERGMAPVPFISVDNARAAYESAKYIADRNSETGEAAILEGIRHAANANERTAGAERAFKENGKLTLAISETGNWSEDEAYAVAKRTFPLHPKLRVVFCGNDMMAFGVVRYLKEVGRHNIRIAGFDDLDKARQYIQAGDMSVTVDQQADKQGYQGVMTALKAIRGESLPKEISLDAALVTNESLKKK